MIRLLLFLVVLLVLPMARATAAPEDGYLVLTREEMTVCPASSLEIGDADFEAATCQQMNAWDMDPQGHAIWVRTTFGVPASYTEAAAPLGLFLSIKASSEVWLNGALLGRNGMPGLSASTEVAGRQDAVFFIPPGTLRTGQNELVFLMSGHHSLIRLAHPLHVAGIAPYGPPRFRMISKYWLSLLTFGLFLAGFLYFGSFAAFGQDRFGSLILAAASVAAGGQLLSEVSRALWSYPYWFQDVRLVLLLFFAGSFGLAMLAHTAHRFAVPRRGWIIAGTVVLTLVTIIYAGGFDRKTMLAIMTPCLGAAVMAGMAAFGGDREARYHLAAFLSFLVLVVVAPFIFLDIGFYFLVAGLLGFLFLVQARAYRAISLEQQETERRRHKLEQALKEREQTEAASITIRSNGRMQKVKAAEIASASGAGDYVELHLTSGDEMLHSATLNALEAELPGQILRVHRSHIVNTHLIAELRRLPSGTGELVLSSGHQVPVSKRIMPRVREALDAV